MGARRRIIRTRNIIFTLLYINCALCNVEYSILNIPKNAISLATKNAFLGDITNSTLNSNFINKKNYQSSFIKYPANIHFFNLIFKDNFSFSIIDYGDIENKINNIVLKKSTAYELLLRYNFEKMINQKIYYNFNIGFVHSQLSYFSSSAFVSNYTFKAYSNKKNIAIKASMQNLGVIINKYINNNEYIKPTYSLGIISTINKEIKVGYDFFHYSNINTDEHILSLKHKLTKHISHLLSYSSFKNQLNNGSHINDVFSAISMGVLLNYSNLEITTCISHMGAAGYVYGITFRFK